MLACNADGIAFPRPSPCWKRTRSRSPGAHTCEHGAMAVWEIVLLVLVVLVVLLFLGGYAGNARVSAARQRRLRDRVAAADQALAAARASDRGWDRSLVEQAVRTAAYGRRPG